MSRTFPAIALTHPFAAYVTRGVDDVNRRVEAGVVQALVEALAFLASQQAELENEDPRLYPDGGCEARAEAVCHLARVHGRTSPYKARAAGLLRFYTDNAPPVETSVSWGFHIAPIVKDFLGVVFVLDPGIRPSGPPSMSTWLNLINANINGVEVRSSSAWRPPVPANEELRTTWLRREWDRQVALGRDPYQVLGDNPPW